MNQKIIVRKVQPVEDKGVWKVAKTLSILERFYFYGLTYKPHKTDALVAVGGDNIFGCVIPIVATLAEERIGIVGGCKTHYVFVDRYNRAEQGNQTSKYKL